MAVNGLTDGRYWKIGEKVAMVTHTHNETNPYWLFTWKDPIKLSDIDKIKIYNRTENNTANRIEGAQIQLLFGTDLVKILKIIPLLVYDKNNSYQVYEFKM